MDEEPQEPQAGSNSWKLRSFYAVLILVAYASLSALENYARQELATAEEKQRIAAEKADKMSKAAEQYNQAKRDLREEIELANNPQKHK